MANDHSNEVVALQAAVNKLKLNTSENILDGNRYNKIRNLNAIIGRIMSGEKTDDLDRMVDQATQNINVPGTLVPISS